MDTVLDHIYQCMIFLQAETNLQIVHVAKKQCIEQILLSPSSSKTKLITSVVVAKITLKCTFG